MDEETPAHHARYRLERNDLFLLAKEVYRPSGWRRLRNAVLFNTAFLCAFCLTLQEWPWNVDWAFVLRQPLFWLWPFLFFFLIAFGHYRSIFSVVAAYRNLSMAEKEIDIRLFDQKLVVEQDGMRSEFPWRLIKSTVALPDRLFMKLSRGEAIALPQKAFPDAAAYRAAVDYVKDRVQHG